MSIATSVIIPCHNHGRFLEHAATSVVVQTRGDWELVIVNDASTDNTASVAQAIVEENPGLAIKVITTDKQSGLGAARNLGIDNSEGEYILPLDADDFLNPAYLSLVCGPLDEGKADIVSCGRRNFGLNNAHVNIDPIVLDLLPLNNLLAYCSMFKRRCWKEVGGYPDNFGREGMEDWEFWMRCSLAKFRFVNVPQILWYHRELPGSMAKKALDDEEYLKARIVTRLPQMYSQASIKRAFAIIEETPDGNKET